MLWEINLYEDDDAPMALVELWVHFAILKEVMRMKKIWSILLFVALTLSIISSLVGCSDERFEYTYAPEELYAVAIDNYGNEYKIDISREKGENQKTIEYDIEYLSRFDDVPVEIGLKGLYVKDGTPLSSEFYHSQFNDTQSVPLDAVGTKVITKACAILYSIKGNDGNGTTDVDCELIFNFNITVKENKILHEYVTIPDVDIPYDYFESNVLNEWSGDYNLSDFTDMIGSNSSTDDFEFGYLTKHIDSDGNVLSYSSNLIKRQTKEDAVYQTEKFHSYDPYAENSRGIYQYNQLKGSKANDLNPAYSLNETDGIFSASTYSQGFGYYGSLPYEADVVKNGSNVLYLIGEKDGYLYLSISGILNNNEYWSSRAVKVTYIIKDNKIVAWLYERTTTSPHEDTYWIDVEYCIPLEEDIEMIDESVLDELCNLY